MKLHHFLLLPLFITIFTIKALAASADILASDQSPYPGDNDKFCREVYDPYEQLNRKIFAFNSVLDHLLLRPISMAYTKITNDYIKTRVGSFIDNISIPLTTVNYGLQLDFDNSMRSLWRLVINTTLGVGGLFDVASKVNLRPQPQTFGNTLAHFGVGPGPYLVMPLLGSSNVRDAADILVANDALNPLRHQLHKDFLLGFTITKTVHDRAMVLPFSDYVTKNSVDPYIAVRSAVHQNRESTINYPDNFNCPAQNQPND